MEKNREARPFLNVQFDAQGDILTFELTPEPRQAVAEEAADDVWVRFDPKTCKVVSVEVLNFSSRLTEAFGPGLTYNERSDPQRLDSLRKLPLDKQ